MQIVINEDEMKTAIRDYITNQGLDTLGKDIEIELTAGRGANGFSASINLIPVVAQGNKMQDNFKPASKDPVLTEVNEIVDQAAVEPAKEPEPKKHVHKEEPKAPAESSEPLTGEAVESIKLDFSADPGPADALETPMVETTGEGVDDVNLFFNS